MSTLSIGVSGLNAAMVGLTTTSHNISNASTPGFNRQAIVQTTNFPMQSGAGFIGQGTNVETVKRIYDQFLSKQVLSAQTGASEMDAYLQQINQINNVLADASSGLSSAMTAFFAGVQTVAANPSSIPARQSMLSSAQTLVSRFQSLNDRMAEIRDGVNSKIISETSLVTNLASQIADINQRIVLAQAGSSTQQPNDLLDQRDKLISDLNKEVRVTTINQGDGTMSVFFGNGQPLVVGVDSFSLSAVAAPDDPERMVVTLKAPGGTTVQVPESQITGGTLGGLISFRSQSLDGAQNALGRVAIALTQTFNNQHQLGQDLTGTLGGAFFSVSSPRVYSNSLNTSVPAATITGSYTATAAADLTTSNYMLTYSAANTFTLTRLSDNVSWTGSGANPTAALTAVLASAGGQGFALSLANTPVIGDSFKIEPTVQGASSISVAVSDPRNIAAAAPFRTAADLTNTGTGKISAGTVNGPAPPNANLQHNVTITFTSPTTYDVVDTSTLPLPTTLVAGAAYTTGANISYNGWTLQISGSPATNDVFRVGPNTNGVADNRNATALAALQTANTMVGGTTSYQGAYSQLVSEVGNKTRDVQSVGNAQQTLADAAVAEQQKMSGVNLDEEAANLLKYQQAYQASARVIDISAKLFDQLLTLGQ